MKENFAEHCMHFNSFSSLCSAILVVLLLIALIKRYLPSKYITSNMTKEYIIKGMNCPHCQASVAKSISSVSGVTQVEVNLSSGIATVEGEHNPDELIRAVRSAGFDVV